MNIMIDPKLFNFSEIFGVIKSTDGLKRNQTRPLRAEVQEISIAKHSGGNFVMLEIVKMVETLLE